MSFESDLKDLINTHSIENGSNTPDGILAKYLLDCLRAFDSATLSRDNWYNVSQDFDRGKRN